MATLDLKKLLRQLGYTVVDRADTWVECLVTRDVEEWRGRGLDAEEALRDVAHQMLPSTLAQHLLAFYPSEVASAALAAKARARPAADRAPAEATAPQPAVALIVRAACKAAHGSGKEPCPEASFCLPERGLCAVADGMKASVAGVTAARMAMGALTATFEHATSLSPIRMRGLPALLAAAQRANKEIFEASRRDPKLRAMTASLAAVLAVGDQVAIAHIGTSRVYRLRRGVFERVTVEPGARSESGKHPAAGAPKPKTPAHLLGADRTAEAETSVATAEAGDVMLVCTQGLHAALTPEDIAEILVKRADPEALAEALVARAAERSPDRAATAAVLRWDA